MTFQPPLLRLAAIMREERGEHIRIGHDAEEFGMVAEFHEVVRRRRCGCCQPERDAVAGFDKFIAIVAGFGLENAALVEDYAGEPIEVKMLDLLVVGDVDARAYVGLGPNMARRNAEFLSLAHHLRGHRERSEVQNIALGSGVDGLTP
ncbi:hypothetical protein [Rhizobium phaseoli]|uniref:hypothetical protein n=1 Tax=Rhizobium phaseoli TaxID=396 RepID=UPI00160A44A8